MLQGQAMREKCPIMSVLVNFKICKKDRKGSPKCPCVCRVKLEQEGVSVARHNISLQRTARPGFHMIRIGLGTSALGGRPRSEILLQLFNI